MEPTDLIEQNTEVITILEPINNDENDRKKSSDENILTIPEKDNSELFEPRVLPIIVNIDDFSNKHFEKIKIASSYYKNVCICGNNHIIRDYQVLRRKNVVERGSSFKPRTEPILLPADCMIERGYQKVPIIKVGTFGRA